MKRKQKLERLAKAANALRSAMYELQKVADDPGDDHYLCQDAAAFHAQVGEILSSDEGQAGLDPLIRRVKQVAEGSRSTRK